MNRRQCAPPVDRFRAVLLTSLTTAGGMAPLIMEQSLAGAVPHPHRHHARASSGHGPRRW